MQTHTCPNGLRIIHETPLSKSPITAIQIFCDVGSIYEHDGIRGASHYIEHMCFKGTEKIPVAKDIFLEYDKIGASFNANTEKQYTRYIAKAQDKYAHNCISIMADMLLNSTFPKKEFKKEEKVVIEENIKNSDDSQSTLAEISDAQIYAGSSYAYSVDTLAYHQKSQRFKYDDIVEYYHTFYRPDRMVLSIVSNLSFAAILKIISKTDFGSKTLDKSCISEKYAISATIPNQTDIQYKLVSRPHLNTTHLVISFRVCNYEDTDRFALNILKKVLSGSMSSRMFMVLREDNGLTYTSQAFAVYYKHSGELTLYAEVDKNKVIANGGKMGVLPLLIHMLNKLCEDGITGSELTLAKTSIQNNKLMHLENNAVSANHNGLELLLQTDSTKKIVSYRKIYDTYYAGISVAEINRVIKKYLRKMAMNVCMIGNQLPSLKTVKRECEKFMM